MRRGGPADAGSETASIIVAPISAAPISAAPIAAAPVIAVATTVVLALAGGLAPAADAQAQSVGADLVYERFGERRAYFRDWLGACRPGGYCSALSYNGAGPDAAGVDADYILRVASPEPDAPAEIIFTGVEAFVGDGSEIRIAVDGRAVATLAADGAEGWRRVENVVNEYRVSNASVADELLAAMRAGAQIRLSFTDDAGLARDVDFSLWGLSAALAWLDGARQP